MVQCGRLQNSEASGSDNIVTCTQIRHIYSIDRFDFTHTPAPLFSCDNIKLRHIVSEYHTKISYLDR